MDTVMISHTQLRGSGGMGKKGVGETSFEKTIFPSEIKIPAHSSAESSVSLSESEIAVEASGKTGIYLIM